MYLIIIHLNKNKTGFNKHSRKTLKCKADFNHIETNRKRNGYVFKKSQRKNASLTDSSIKPQEKHK